MKGLREKLQNKKGFTLVEMLIVVAIIAILIAISIPLVNNALESAKDATDDANFRSAAALGSIKYLTEGDSAAGTYTYYTNNASQGQLVKSETTPTVPTGYSQYTAQCTGSGHGATGTGSGKHIQVVIATGGDVAVTWA